MQNNKWKLRFYTIWSGQAVSLIGSALTQFVLIWWIADKTDSVLFLSIAGAVGMLPYALFSFLGGAFADRYSRRKILIISDSIIAFCILIIVMLFATGTIAIWHIFILMFIRSTMQSFQMPAASASTANLVPESFLTRAGGMNQTLQGIMTIAAAPLGAMALGLFSFTGALMIDIFTALLGIVPLFFFDIPQPPVDKAKQSLTFRNLKSEIKEGLYYVRKKRGLYMLFAITGLVVLIVVPTFILTPLLVKQHFNGGVNEVAMMEGFAGVGVILGGIFITIWTLFKRRVYTIMISYGISCATVGLTALMPSNALWLGIIWWTLSGFSYSTGNAPFIALMQSKVPNELQGRVLSLFHMVIGLASPIGIALAGPVGELIGIRGLFILGGFLSGAVSFLALISKPLRRIESDDFGTA